MARYLVDKLAQYGAEAEILEFDSLISWPLEGLFELLEGESPVEQIGSFWASSCFSLQSSDVSSPPYFCFQRCAVRWLTPCRRQTSTTVAPASCSRRMPLICCGSSSCP